MTGYIQVMSDCGTITLNHFPLELLHNILQYLDIPDIIRIRGVSRHLSALSYARDIWSDAYRRATFIRPPGPFPSQSAHYLETALIRAFRVNKNLRNSQASTAVRKTPFHKLRQIRYTERDIGGGLVFGRFLLVAFDKEVRCYDLDTDGAGDDPDMNGYIFYRPTGATLKSFHCISSIDAEGQPCACAVLKEAVQTSCAPRATLRISIYSLRMVGRSGLTLDLLHQFEQVGFYVSIVDLGPRALIVIGSGLDSSGTSVPLLVALDLSTRIHFTLPPFTEMWEIAQLPELATSKIPGPISISTSTHLLMAKSFYTTVHGYCTFILAFTLPCFEGHPDPTLLSTPLTPSHSGIVAGIIRYKALFRDAVVEASTQDVLITIRVSAFEPSRPRFPISKYGILRLGATHPQARQTKPGPITLRLLGSFPTNESDRGTRIPIHSSSHGVGREFYMSYQIPTRVMMIEYNIESGSGGGGKSDSRLISSPRSIDFPTSRKVVDYDPYGGRVCLQLDPVGKHRVMEILDFAHADGSADP